MILPSFHAGLFGTSVGDKAFDMGRRRKTPRKAAASANKTKATFDCTLEFMTKKPNGDKTIQRFDALSLVIIELVRGPRHLKFDRDVLRSFNRFQITLGMTTDLARKKATSPKVTFFKPACQERQFEYLFAHR